MKLKNLAGIFVLALLIISGVAQAQVEKAVLKVAGNCSMCKKTIENAADVKGVKSFSWNAEMQELSLEFDSNKTNLDKIAKGVAKAGYDNQLYRATDETYENLHKCCLYTRMQPDSLAVPQK
jgi:copper chaperone CopZ